MDEARRDGDSLRAEFEQREAELIRAAKATRLNGQREMFWRLEVRFVRDLPRPSHVGRALFETNATREKSAVGYVPVYNYLMERTPPPLPEKVRSAISTLVNPDSSRDQCKPASSTVTKSMDARSHVLSAFLQAVQVKKVRAASRYWLTPLGCKLFKEWPTW
jgi:hypothetical protein